MLILLPDGTIQMSAPRRARAMSVRMTTLVVPLVGLLVTVITALLS
jgi:hypothetical protein